MNQLSAIIVGLGDQSLNDHVPTLLRRNDVKIVGACDPSINAQHDFNRKFPELEDKVTLAEDLDELLRTVQPDFAVVAVPHNRYMEIVTSLCQQQLYFLKEKPLARNLVEANAILSIPGFAKYGFTATQRRYGEIYQQAKNSIGSLGNLYMFHAVYKLNIDAPHESWRGIKATSGGGCLIDMGYHLVDQLVWWFGMPQRIHAQISALAVPNAHYDAEDSATVLFRYNSGLHGTLLVSRAAGEKYEGYELYGSNGYMVGSKKQVTFFNRRGDVVQEISQPDGQILLDAQLDFFISRIISKVGFADLQQDHLNNMKLIQRCYDDALAES